MEFEHNCNMYPKMKVREQKEEEPVDEELSPTTAFMFLKTTESLSVEGHKSGTSMNWDTKGVSQSSNIAGTKSVLLRPRAVLSSPDNDRIIGIRNRLSSGKNKISTSASQVIKGNIPLNSRKCQKVVHRGDGASAKPNEKT